MKKDEIRIEEVTAETLSDGLEVRNGIFNPITPEDWHRGAEKSGSLAYLNDKPIGFIPLMIKDIQIAPGVTIRAAFENAVGTKEESRGKGIGSKMIEGACEFLKGKADALFVYRGNERSQAYHFYEKTGHVDLLYTRKRYCDASIAKKHKNIRLIEGKDNIIPLEARLIELFTDTFQGYGGFPERREGYYTESLNSTFYASRPVEFYMLALEENNRITAYAIVGKGKNPIRKNDLNKLEILEMAAVCGDSSRIIPVLEAACDFALQCGKSGLGLVSGDQHPFAPALESLGFEMTSRGIMVMGLSFDSNALFEKLWRGNVHLPGVELKVWTPKQDFILAEAERHRPEQDIRKVTLEMKEDTFTRWLMGRIDFKARVQEGSITMQNGNASIVNELSKAIPHRPWEYHHVDFC